MAFSEKNFDVLSRALVPSYLCRATYIVPLRVAVRTGRWGC